MRKLTGGSLRASTGYAKKTQRMWLVLSATGLRSMRKASKFRESGFQKESEILKKKNMNK